MEDSGGLDREAASEKLSVPSLVSLAVDSIRRMVLSGRLQPGERLIEERLTEQLGISRPPLREAMRLLQQQGLLVTIPRRGTRVVTMTEQDVFEVLTLRSGIERMAVELGVPVSVPERLERCREALSHMETCARTEERAQLVEQAYEFHASIVGLAGHSRLEQIYHSVQAQVTLCMAQNLRTREQKYEDLVEHVARHRELLEIIEEGDVDAVLHALAHHGERSFFLTSKRALTLPDMGKAPGQQYP